MAITAKSVVSGPVVNAEVGTVTQITNATTAVTLDQYIGKITTVASTAGASGASPDVFTLNNSKITAASAILVSIQSHAGTGNPVVSVNAVAAGSCQIVVSSCSAAALNGIHVIAFRVLS